MEVKKAYRQHVVTDQGNGSAYCSNCHTNLSGVFVSPCPKCAFELEDTSAIPYPYGGSDF